MEIRIGKEWVIQSSGNAMNIILAKVPQAPSNDINAVNQAIQQQG